MKELWIVGKNVQGNDLMWEFQGVFDTREDAEAACEDHNYFVGPAVLNKKLPHETVEWKGAWRPVS